MIHHEHHKLRQPALSGLSLGNPEKKKSEKHWKPGNYEVNIDCHLFCHDEL